MLSYSIVVFACSTELEWWATDGTAVRFVHGMSSSWGSETTNGCDGLKLSFEFPFFCSGLKSFFCVMLP